ncbi:MAG: hypothetical protein JNM58_00930 [Xanthomonadaceae bacterium]|nr:hypothetical protein [Xanthomonadaceae bacterium]
MRRLLELLSIGLLIIVIAGLFYGGCLWGVMARNARRMELPVFTLENFEQSWLTALIIVAVTAFAAWGSIMYDKSGGDGDKN